MEVKSFVGGAHIPHYKSFTEKLPITKMSVPKELIIPLLQHSGAICEPLVSVGDKVAAGQKIGESTEYISAPVHASVSGIVSAIEPRPCYDGGKVMSIVIETDQQVQEFECGEKRDPSKMSVEELKECIKEAGIVGMGGAAFPTHVNINTATPIDSLLLNGAECEPFLTCDHRQMVERADDMIAGAEIIMRIIGATKCYAGIEVNKPDAIEAVNSRIQGRTDIEVVPLAVKYPQGFKSHLIKAVTGRDVPRGARSSALGCIVRNVGTTIASYEAVVYGKPSIERVVTVSGPNVPKPGNYIVKIGTPIGHLLKECGVEDLDGFKVIVGGPMTGVAQNNLDAPIVKSNTGLLVLPPDMVWQDEAYSDCVRCGKCVDHCPVYLYPNQLSIYAESGMLVAAEKCDIMDCIECGICSFYCPANRPIVHFIQRVKPQVNKMQRERSKKIS
ncbi:MAG: electron transport complex subunit RsxC [Firmicutes bacterium]|nr:electron transport complex subunit RsxC [Bacillota bacterium]